MKNRYVLIFLVLVMLLVIASKIQLNKKEEGLVTNSVGNAHLEYLYVQVEEVRSESIVVSLSKNISKERDDTLPQTGDFIYLFIPKETLQKDILTNITKGEKLTVSVYGRTDIYNNGGLFTIVIENIGQLNMNN